MKSHNEINLDEATLKRLTYYAYLTGKPISTAVNEAINEWLEISGDLIIAELEERRRKRKKKLSGKRNATAAICIDSSNKFHAGTDVPHTAAM